MILSLASAIGIANLFGAGASTDAFFFARKLVSNLAMGFERAFQLIQVPLMVQRAHREGMGSLRHHLRKRSWQTLAVTVAFSALGLVFAPQIVGLLAPGFEARQADFSTTFLRILILTLPISGVTGLSGAVLNALRVFSLPAIARLIPRVCVVLVLVLGPRSMGLSWLATAVLVGTVVMGVLFLWSVHHAFEMASEWKASPEGIAASGVYTKGRVVAMLIAQLHMIGASWIDMAFASLAGIGSVATLEFGQRLTNILPGVASNSVTSVYYTEFAHALSAGDLDRFRGIMRDSLRVALFLSAPLAALTVVLSGPVVSLVLEHGAFSEQAAQTTKSIIMILALLLPINALLGTTVSAIFADPDQPHLKLIGSTTVVAITIRIAVTASLIGALGVLAVPIGLIASMGALFFMCFYWQSLKSGFAIGRGDLKPFGAILLAALACGVITWLCWAAISPTSDHRLSLAMSILLSGGVGAGAYLLVSMLLKVEEAGMVARRLRKIGRRRG